ncbi:MAG: hypothetical protein RJA22_3311 [Verrucomicrobiota bacterium]|jgi:prepilin-type N-terminal cleavage/methylation domain-containing protein
MTLLSSSGGRGARGGGRRAFTILEVMLAIGIFAMVLTAIYTTWICILRGSKAGLQAAQDVQRSRIALRTLEAAFNCTEMFVANMNQYLFVADTSGDMAAVSLAARVPDDFLGANQFRMLSQKVRRVTFYTEPGSGGMAELKMTIAPILVDTNSTFMPYTVTLAKDVTRFQMSFFDAQKNEWLDEWKYTNQLPKLVQIALGVGKTAGNAGQPYDEVFTLVALPSVAVQADVQGGLAAGQRQPGMTNFPGQMPGQMPGQIPGQMPGRFPGQMPGQYPGQYPGPFPGQPFNPSGGGVGGPRFRPGGGR